MIKKEEILKFCQDLGLKLEEQKKIPYATQFRFLRGKEKLILNLYDTGKTLLQGKESEIKDKLSSFLGLASKEKTSETTVSHKAMAWIGIDESGKGDYFGPLVTAAVFVHRDQEKELKSFGVQDGKKLSDAKIHSISEKIKNKCTYTLRVQMPEDYNALYEDIDNLNHLLAREHAYVAKALKAKHPEAELIYSDQFARDRKLLDHYFGELSKILLQTHKAEEDLAVACASIVARDAFLHELENMKQKWSFQFYKGASEQVERAAENFVHIYNAENLRKVAKLHFKTTEKILS